MTASAFGHDKAAARHEHAAVTQDQSAAFWEALGNSERAGLHREMAIHERAGAALELRWAEAIRQEDTGAAARRFEDRFESDGTVEDRELEVEAREVEVEMRETEITLRALGIVEQEGMADDRDKIADGRDREADAREEAADRRERLADEREGTAEAREIERLDRLRQCEERDRAAVRRAQAAVMREEWASERDHLYRGNRIKQYE